MSLVGPQAVDSPLTRAAIFLVVALKPGGRNTVLGLCADLSSLLRGVGFRDPSGALSCVLGFGASAWDALFGTPRPAGLHPFREIKGQHHAPATPGDLLFHMRATRLDMCFELAAATVTRLEDAATVVDKVHGFKFFDERDLLGFVDGTENPSAQAAVQATLIGDEDPGFTGGSYVIIQKYLHNLKAWNALPVERQETIIGRKKPSDNEQRPFEKASYAHNVLTDIEEGGQQLHILRDNMPFGEVGKGEFGTYFIGYARSPDRIEKMLNNMFIGNPPGTYDRILDFSTAVTGGLFFVPGVVSGRCVSAGREGVNFRKL